MGPLENGAEILYINFSRSSQVMLCTGVSDLPFAISMSDVNCFFKVCCFVIFYLVFCVMVFVCLFVEFCFLFFQFDIVELVPHRRESSVPCIFGCPPCFPVLKTTFSTNAFSLTH